MIKELQDKFVNFQSDFKYKEIENQLSKISEIYDSLNMIIVWTEKVGLINKSIENVYARLGQSIDFDDVNLLFRKYVEELDNNLQTEMKLRYTVAGVHRDDVNFYINNMPARDFASQGQLRSAALSLKLSEAEMIRRRNRTCPVIILDDILSELDHVRRGFVVNNIDRIEKSMKLL